MESFLTLFSGFRWQDGLDILLNAYILFRLYVLFRGTNVFRGLLGISLLWLAGQVAQTLGLIVTNWAMQGVIAVAALIIIIIFRNEISGVLQTRDFKSFFWGIPQYQKNTPLQILVDSVYELAEKKIGALIVLPLKRGLDSVVQGGIPVNGQLSKEILVSIFWPDNPVHDGAVIIQGDRIVKAGVILPLSRRDDLPPFFGTRHRAGLGVSEHTDAVVIVVSEERGKVTVFKENEIHRIDSREELTRLISPDAGKDSATTRFRNQTLELITAGLIILFGVTGIWASFSKGIETLAEYVIPVEFINPDQKMEIISASASNVKLQLSGARPLINSVNPEQIKIKLNLSDALVGINTLDITNDNILLPPGISLKKIEPAELDITLDTLIKKEVFIQPHWVGRLNDGLIMTKAVSVPETITVKGGGLALQNLSTLFTQKIALNKITQSGSLTTTLVLESPTLEVEGSPTVQIQYTIETTP